MRPVRATYLLPVRSSPDEDIDELTDYLRGLPDWIELIVVDGSPAPAFERNAVAWAPLGRHLQPDPGLVTRVDPQTITSVRPVLNPLAVDPLRSVAFQTRQARQRFEENKSRERNRQIADGAALALPQSH